MKDCPYLFAYGTLRSSCENEFSQFVRQSARRVGEGRARGLLFQLEGYPGMVLSDEPNECVLGEVYRLTDPAGAWPVLDEYEGPDFERRRIPVTVGDGRTLEAWVYIYRSDTSGKARIVSGDYLQVI